VIKRLHARFDIHYAIAFLPDRLILVNVGKNIKKSLGREAGKLAISQVLGTIPIAGDIISDKIGDKIEQKTRKTEDQAEEENFSAISELSVSDIINLDKHNFIIMYDEIKKIAMVKHPKIRSFWAEMKIEARKKEKFMIAPGQYYEECLNIVQSFLPNKLEVRG
jgi:hypothetical protein